jgi:putative tryptophan/tyrosine transport system substrate-binding protein
MMKRREFISLLGGAAAAWPLAARAQQTAMPVIGFLSSGASDRYRELFREFYDGLSEAGFREGQNVAIEYRWANGENDRLPMLARDLVGRKASAIVAISDSAALALKAATSAIPIVFFVGNDPVRHGLVPSLNPTGNLTGVTNLNVELGPKRLELLHELVPARDAKIALLVNPIASNFESVLRDMRDAAKSFGLPLHVLHAHSPAEIDLAFASLAELHSDALVIGPDNFFNLRSQQLGQLTLRYSIPAIFQTRDFVTAGGLISYATTNSGLPRVVGSYVGRILKGEKPANLPVHQATKIELFINVKTAKTLGLTVPLPLLGRADEVIE